jgi:hypothetical protein
LAKQFASLEGEGKSMNWYLHHWWNVGLVIAGGVFAYLAIAWDSLEVVQRVLLASFGVLPLHQFEEWGWPGGEPAVLNKVIFRSDIPDRYPANPFNAMVVNIVVGYPVLLVAVFFPDVIWLGLFAGVLFGLAQFGFHGIVTNVKLRWFYNPGLLTVVLGWIPLGVVYVSYVSSRDLVSVWDWVIAVILAIAFVVVVMLKLTFTWLADRNSPHAFTDHQMRQWNVDARLARVAAKKSASASGRGRI